MYGEAVPEGWGQDIQWWAMLFYADDGLIASMQLEWLQGEFDALTWMLNRV